MTRAEFHEVMEDLTAGSDVGLSARGYEVYFEMLGDLPYRVLKVAARMALCQKLYGKFPPIEMLRRISLEVAIGHDARMTAGEAWEIATRACGDCDVEVKGSVERAFRHVPPIVGIAIKRFGFKALYNLPSRAIETARAQFRDIFNGIMAQEKEQAAWTPMIHQELAAIAEEVKRGKIGHEIDRFTPTLAEAVVARRITQKVEGKS